MAELKRNLLLVHTEQTTEQTFEGKRAYRNAYKEASSRLVLKVEDNKLLVKRAPEFDWLESLYPDVSEFYVSFSDVRASSRRTKRRDAKSREKVELWVLSLKD